MTSTHSSDNGTLDLKRHAACLIILYHPQTEVVEQLVSSYVNRFAHAIFIDNSPEPNPTWIEKINRVEGTQIHYKANHENKGIGFALNQGFKLASELGATWVLTMDQDSWFETDDFFKALEKETINTNIAIYGAGIHKPPPFFNAYNNTWWKVLVQITSGNLVRVNAWKSIEGFRENWFIDEIDHDFCLRLKSQNWMILCTRFVCMKHALGTATKCRWLLTNKSVEIALHSPERTYYIIRNAWFIVLKYARSEPFFALNRIKMMLIKFALILMLYPNKWRYCRFWCIGLLDGLMRNTRRKLL